MISKTATISKNEYSRWQDSIHETEWDKLPNNDLQMRYFWRERQLVRRRHARLTANDFFVKAHCRAAASSSGEHTVVFNARGRIIRNDCTLVDRDVRKTWLLLNPTAAHCYNICRFTPRATRLAALRMDYYTSEFRKNLAWAATRLSMTARVLMGFLNEDLGLETKTKSVHYAGHVKRIPDAGKTAAAYAAIVSSYRGGNLMITDRYVNEDLAGETEELKPPAPMTNAQWDQAFQYDAGDARFDLAFCLKYPSLPKLKNLSIYRQRAARNAFHSFVIALKYAVRRWFALKNLPYTPWRHAAYLKHGAQ